MTRFRTQWLAVAGASLLVTLSVSTAFGAHPETDSPDNRGHQVAAYVHSLIEGLGTNQDDEQATEDQQDDTTDGDAQEGADQSEDQQDVEQQDEAASDTLTTDPTDPSAHGQCVSQAAQGDEVGGANENHGGAVSQAARETCWQTDAGDGGEPTDPPTEVSDGPGNSENHGSHGGGHGNH